MVGRLELGIFQGRRIVTISPGHAIYIEILPPTKWMGKFWATLAESFPLIISILHNINVLFSPATGNIAHYLCTHTCAKIARPDPHTHSNGGGGGYPFSNMAALQRNWEFSRFPEEDSEPHYMHYPRHSTSYATPMALNADKAALWPRKVLRKKDAAERKHAQGDEFDIPRCTRIQEITWRLPFVS